MFDQKDAIYVPSGRTGGKKTMFDECPKSFMELTEQRNNAYSRHLKWVQEQKEKNDNIMLNSIIFKKFAIGF